MILGDSCRSWPASPSARACAARCSASTSIRPTASNSTATSSGHHQPRRQGRQRRPHHPRAGAGQGLPRHLARRHPQLPDLPARPTHVARDLLTDSGRSSCRSAMRTCIASWPPTPATSCSTRPAVPAPPPPSPSNGAAAGSPSTPRAWRWRWPAPASWARAIRSTCWPIPAKARSRKPKSPAPRRVRSRCRQHPPRLRL
jgi:hypothetical protein